MKLSLNGIASSSEWEKAGYHLPAYDIAQITENTNASPEWVHFGAGNIFRAYHARLAQEMIEKGLINSGIVVAEGFDYEIIDKAYKPFDNLSILAILKSDGSVEKQVIGSVTASANPVFSATSACSSSPEARCVSRHEELPQRRLEGGGLIVTDPQPPLEKTRAQLAFQRHDAERPAEKFVPALAQEFCRRIVKLLRDLIFDEFHDPPHISVGDVRPLHALQLGTERLHQQHIPLAEEFFRACGVEDNLTVVGRTYLKTDAGREIDLDGAGDDRIRRPLSGNDEVDPCGATLLGDGNDGFFRKTPGLAHHQVPQLIDDDDKVGKLRPVHRVAVEFPDSFGSVLRKKSVPTLDITDDPLKRLHGVPAIVDDRG